MMKPTVCLVLLSLMVLATAAHYPYFANYGGYWGGYPARHWPGYHPLLARGTYFFYGYYPGHCGADGLYYHDEKSFTICSNGNPYHQRCAPGSRNSAFNVFKLGSYYGYRDFCDVNVNDIGIRD